jgi:hypothetical protein
MPLFFNYINGARNILNLYRLKQKCDKCKKIEKGKNEEEKIQIKNIGYKIPQYKWCLKMIEGLRRFGSICF